MPRNFHDDAKVRFATVQMIWQQNRVAEAEAGARELVRSFPQHEGASLLLSVILRGQGKLDAACHVVLSLCRARGFDIETSLRGARFIQECQRQPLAEDVCDAAIKSAHVPPPLLAVAGNIARELGAFGKARVRYLAALDAGIDLNLWHVLGALAHTRRYTDTLDPDFACFAAHFDDRAFSARSRAATGFGLAKARDDIGESERAAAVLRDANALARRDLAWNAAGWLDFVDARRRERVAHPHEPIDTSFVPVFIVGLPRSGTTLTAVHLARTVGAQDRGELRVLRFIADTLISGGHLEDPAAIAEAARLYFTHSRQDDAPATWYIDQDPLNFRYLHLIDAMFPQSRVIVCRRNRRDTALSLWFQNFAHRDCAFAYDFDGIEGYINGYESLMQHWRNTLSVPIFTVDYEDLVTDPKTTLAGLREFIGAPDEEAPRTPAPIASASVWQSRQPIYTTSIDRWRRYLPYIPELVRVPE
jgi:hypothetical protein